VSPFSKTITLKEETMITITPLDLNKLLSTNNSLTLLDVRTPAEFNGAHIAGSVNIPLDQLNPFQFLKNNYLASEQKVYILCQSGTRAQNAAKLFDKDGLGGAVVLEGGISAWIKEGFKVKVGNSKVISLERQVRIAAGSFVLLGVLFGKFVHPGFYWISVLVGAGLINAGITNWCGMGLLLARFHWNQKT